MAEDKLTKDDLVLLMESYRNMIIMHQTILDQSSKTIDKLDGIATKQDNLFLKQSAVCSTLEKITTKIDSTNEKLSDTNIRLKDATNKVEGVGGNLTKKIEEHGKKSVEDNGKIISKIHLGWGGMVTIIIGLIGIIITLSNFLYINPTILP